MTSQYQQESINLAGKISVRNLSVNEASVDDGLFGDSIVLRTSEQVNSAGSFTGGGLGNKAIAGVIGLHGDPISSLNLIGFSWTNVVGPAGPNFIPAEAVTTVTPYINMLVDFDPNGGGDLRLLVLLTDQLAPAISESLGTYLNDGNNLLSYLWDRSKNVSIVGAPPDPVPGGVVPSVSVGASWPENSYTWEALVAANPDAIFVDAYPADGGMPAGAIIPAITLNSGDSGTVIKSGKRIIRFGVNGGIVA